MINHQLNDRRAYASPIRDYFPIIIELSIVTGGEAFPVI